MKLCFAMLALLVVPVIQAQDLTKGSVMSHHTSGSFVPEIKPVAADLPAAPSLGRMMVNKVLHGGIEGVGVGQMLTAMADAKGPGPKGSGGYVAVEVVTGKVDGRAGSFALIHLGLMDRGKPTLNVSVVPDSGTGELTGLTGTFVIHIAADGKHTYDFDYTLPDGGAGSGK